MKQGFIHQKARELRSNMTDAEKKIWSKLRRKQQGGYKFNKQHIIDDKYIVDFYCPAKILIIEIDGGQHCDNEKDKIRDQYLADRKYKILRFWNNEVNENIEGVIWKIRQILGITEE